MKVYVVAEEEIWSDGETTGQRDIDLVSAGRVGVGGTVTAEGPRRVTSFRRSNKRRKGGRTLKKSILQIDMYGAIYPGGSGRRRQKNRVDELADCRDWWSAGVVGLDVRDDVDRSERQIGDALKKDERDGYIVVSSRVTRPPDNRARSWDNRWAQTQDNGRRERRRRRFCRQDQDVEQCEKTRERSASQCQDGHVVSSSACSVRENLAFSHLELRRTL